MNPTFPIGDLCPILFWTFWAQNSTFGLLFLGLFKEITIFRSTFASLYNLHISKVVFNLDKGVYSLALILTGVSQDFEALGIVLSEQLVI